MKNFMFVGLVLVLIVLALFFPFAVIWAFNTLFTLAIPYTFWTWLSVVIINLWLLPSVKVKN